jgi:hypothetical protein
MLARVPPPRLPACRHVDMPDFPLAAGPAAGPTRMNGDGRRLQPGHLPGLVEAAPPCRLWPRRHVPRVAWASLPPLPGGLFWQKISEVVLSGNTLAQVV